MRSGCIEFYLHILQFNYNPENAIGFADIVKYFVYKPSYVACLLVKSGCIEFYLHILQFNYNPENAIVCNLTTIQKMQ